jgi:hypothetical protein
MLAGLEELTLYTNKEKSSAVKYTWFKDGETMCIESLVWYLAYIS